MVPGWFWAARRQERLVALAAQLPQALAVVADVTVRADVDRLMAAALERFGQVDVWVNNAGQGISRPVSQLTDEDVDQMMLVNLKAPLYGMQAVLPHFKERGTGHIINVSSALGRVPFAPIRSAYSAAKHALNALTANLRMELRTTHPGIVVSSLLPGVVATEFGLNARGGGVDSRKLPNAQTAEQVSDIVAELINNPRADVYTQPAQKQMAAAYYAAEDMGAVEAGFGAGPPRP